MEPKIGLGTSGGPHGSPKGPQGASWEPKGAILVDFGIVLGSFGMPNWNQKSVLEHLVGPMAPPRGPKGSLGSPRVPFWRIWGSFWGHLGDEKHANIDATNQCFFEHWFYWILLFFGAWNDGSRKHWICKVCRSYRGIRRLSNNTRP